MARFASAIATFSAAAFCTAVRLSSYSLRSTEARASRIAFLADSPSLMGAFSRPVAGAFLAASTRAETNLSYVTPSVSALPVNALRNAFGSPSAAAMSPRIPFCVPRTSSFLFPLAIISDRNPFPPRTRSTVFMNGMKFPERYTSGAIISHTLAYSVVESCFPARNMANCDASIVNERGVSSRPRIILRTVRTTFPVSGSLTSTLDGLSHCLRYACWNRRISPTSWSSFLTSGSRSTASVAS